MDFGSAAGACSAKTSDIIAIKAATAHFIGKILTQKLFLQGYERFGVGR